MQDIYRNQHSWNKRIENEEEIEGIDRRQNWKMKYRYIHIVKRWNLIKKKGRDSPRVKEMIND